MPLTAGPRRAWGSGAALLDENQLLRAEGGGRRARRGGAAGDAQHNGSEGARQWAATQEAAETVSQEGREVRAGRGTAQFVFAARELLMGQIWANQGQIQKLFSQAEWKSTCHYR